MMINRISRNKENPSLINTAHQRVGDDTEIVPHNLTGDCRVWGHWIWEDGSTKGLTKIATTNYPPTEIDTTGIANMRDIARYELGNMGTASNAPPSGYGANGYWTSGFTETINYFSSTAMTNQGQVTIPATGLYLLEYQGYISASGGSITSYACLIRRITSGVPSFNGTGGFSMLGVSLSRVNYHQRVLISLAATEIVQPGILISVTAGSVALTTCTWQVKAVNHAS